MSTVQRPAEPRPATLLKVADVAAHLRVKDEAVLALIHGKRLRAIDVAKPGSQRPRWRIAPAELERFLEGRSTEAAAAPRKRRAKAGHVTEFF